MIDLFIEYGDRQFVVNVIALTVMIGLIVFVCSLGGR